MKGTLTIRYLLFKKNNIFCKKNFVIWQLLLFDNYIYFKVKEVDMGLAADVGTLQRLPRAIGSQSLVNELCLTARKLKAPEAEKIGLVSRVRIVHLRIQYFAS